MTEEKHTNCVYCNSPFDGDPSNFSQFFRTVCQECYEIEKLVGKDRLKDFAAKVSFDAQINSALCALDVAHEFEDAPPDVGLKAVLFWAHETAFAGFLLTPPFLEEVDPWGEAGGDEDVTE